MFQRKRIRLKGYDYAQNGFYFITICSYKRWCVLGEVIEDKMELNEWGQIVDCCWLNIPQHFRYVQLNEYVIMPNHIHGILCIRGVPAATACRGRTEQYGKPIVGSIPTIIRSFKSASTKYINAIRGGRETVWHPNYFEHIVRDEMDLKRIQQYILDNPKVWAKDKENPERV